MEQRTRHNTFHGNRYRKAQRENAWEKIVTKVAQEGMARGGNSLEEEERREMATGLTERTRRGVTATGTEESGTTQWNDMVQRHNNEL
jgi:hypothetical protein